MIQAFAVNLTIADTESECIYLYTASDQLRFYQFSKLCIERRQMMSYGLINHRK